MKFLTNNVSLNGDFHINNKPISVMEINEAAKLEAKQKVMERIYRLYYINFVERETPADITKELGEDAAKMIKYNRDAKTQKIEHFTNKKQENEQNFKARKEQREQEMQARKEQREKERLAAVKARRIVHEQREKVLFQVRMKTVPISQEEEEHEANQELEAQANEYLETCARPHAE